MVCHAADMKGGSPMPDTGVLRVLTSHQRATGWRRQVEVEKSLGLEKGAISSYFRMLGRAHKSKSKFAARRKLRAAGVYRVQGLRLGTPRPPKNWRIAFAGKGNPRPVLHLSRESHPFAPDGAPGGQGGSLAGVAEPSERGQGSPSTAVMVRWVCNSRDPCSVPGYSYFTMCSEISEHDCLTSYWYTAAILDTVQQ